MTANSISIVDMIPAADSGESQQNSEPSIAVNPSNPLQMVAAAFGGGGALYFVSTDGGATWSDFGAVPSQDKSIAWAADGSTALTASLEDNKIDTYAMPSPMVTSGGNFGSRRNMPCSSRAC